MKRSPSVSEYFRFTRKESIAILILASLILLIFFFPALTGKSAPPPVNTDTAWIAKARSLQEAGDDGTEDQSGDHPGHYYRQQSKNWKYEKRDQRTAGELFYFDPNTLSEDGWKKLGLRDKTIHTILNFRSHGGQFHKPEDMQRIYGLFPDEFEKLAPYIQIAEPEKNTAAVNTGENVQVKNQTNNLGKPRSYAVVEINTADTSALLPLPGIGSKLAARIISFRDKLGGFYAVSQIGETFGLPDSTFQKIKPYLHADAAIVRTVNINTATAEVLKTHPYIRWALANAIIAYRNEHGPFGKKEDLKKVMAMTEEIYTKVAPYIIVQ